MRDDKLRTLIWTPDASRALALLGNTSEAYGQSWHLPIDQDRLTYRDFITLAAETFGRPSGYRVVPEWLLRAAGIFDPQAREIRELLPRYRCDNRFDSSKFQSRFPDFHVTSYREGLQAIHHEFVTQAPA